MRRLQAQSITLPRYVVVTLTRAPLETVSINDRDAPANISNEMLILKSEGRYGHGLATKSHLCADRLMRYMNDVAPNVIVGRQKPTADFLLDRMLLVANCHLAGLE
jgi:hypothetical protein